MTENNIINNYYNLENYETRSTQNDDNYKNHTYQNQILNSTFLHTKFGKNCKIINSTIKNCIIFDKCEIIDSYLEDCIVYNGVIINDSHIYKKVIIENNANIKSSYIYDYVHIGANSNVGPFSHIHTNCDIEDNCRIGNFVEIKKSHCGNNTKIAHLSYVGDADVGNKVNIGAGTIFCNYDGKQKHPSKIGDETFVGSNCLIIAPRNIGSHCTIGAGSIISEDIDDITFYLRRTNNIKNTKNRDYME